MSQTSSHVGSHGRRLRRRRRVCRRRPSLADGRYELAQPVLITPDDSGTEKSPTVIRTEAASRSVFSGGRRLEAVLMSANDGLTPFPKTRWVPSRWPGWVLDVIHSDQRQRVGTGDTFTRKAGTAAVYRPKLQYYEWQTKAGSQYESWVIFSLSGKLERTFLDLTADDGFCHLLDPDQLIADHLRQVSRHVHYRRPGHALRAQAAFLNLIGLVATSQQIEPRLRLVRETAKKLLVNERLTVREVARRLGYSSEFQLSRSFKRFEGVSPTTYLKSMTTKQRP